MIFEQTAPSCLDILDHNTSGGEIAHAVILTIMASISMLCCSFVAWLMHSNKQLLQHPHKLIFYMCISEAIAANASLFALISNKWIVCYFNLNMLYSYTVPFGRTPEESFNLLRNSNNSMITYFQFLSLSLNFFLCLDLIMTLRNPFSPHDRRMKYYKYASLLMALMCSVTTMDSTGRSGNITLVMVNNAVSGITITSYMIFAIFSCAYSYRMTTRPGMSTEIRKDFIQRHIQYVLVYICVWLPYLGLTFYTIFACQIYKGLGVEVINPTTQDQFTMQIKKWWDYNNSTSAFTGFLMACIRVREPAMWEVFVATITCKRSSLKQRENQPTQLQFLMSSLNIELVHIILTAVSQKTVGTPKHDTDFKVYMDYDFKSKNSFTLDCIEIDNRKDWDLQDDSVHSSLFSIGKNVKESLLPRFSSVLGIGQRKTREVVDQKLIINEDIEVTEWSPDVFAFLRHRDNYSNKILLESLDPLNNKDMVFKAGESQGKSGSFFFFSKDQRFIIKTMTDSDFKAFQRIMKSYFQRVCTDDSCLLARIYGIYTIKMEDQQPVQLIVMGNSKSNATNIQGVFDLKGSMVNRYCHPPKEGFKPTATLKDKNLLKINTERLWLNFRNKDRSQIIQSMKDDVALLEKFNLMDYSLLLCVSENTDYLKVKNRSGGGIINKEQRKALQGQFMANVKTRYTYLSKNCKFIYHIGIIDYLQDYHLEKRMENFAKETILGKSKQDHGEISAVPPSRYAPRFIQFMAGSVIIDQLEHAHQQQMQRRLTQGLPDL